MLRMIDRFFEKWLWLILTVGPWLVLMALVLFWGKEF